MSERVERIWDNAVRRGRKWRRGGSRGDGGRARYPFLLVVVFIEQQLSRRSPRRRRVFSQQLLLLQHPPRPPSTTSFWVGVSSELPFPQLVRLVLSEQFLVHVEETSKGVLRVEGGGENRGRLGAGRMRDESGSGRRSDGCVDWVKPQRVLGPVRDAELGVGRNGFLREGEQRREQAGELELSGSGRVRKLKLTRATNLIEELSRQRR